MLIPTPKELDGIKITHENGKVMFSKGTTEAQKSVYFDWIERARDASKKHCTIIE